MQARWFGKTLLMGVALALCAGSALVWAGWSPTDGERGPAERERERRQVAGNALVFLTIAEAGEVELVNTDNGVKLTVAAAKPELVEKLQERAAKVVARMQVVSKRAPKELPPGEQAGLLNMMAAGDAVLGVENTEGGVVYNITSEKPEAVQGLQALVPEMVADAAQRRQQQQQRVARRQMYRSAMATLAEEAVKIEVEQAEDGIAVKVISADPEMAAKIEENLSAYFEGLKETGRRMRRWQAERGAEGARRRWGPGEAMRNAMAVLADDAVQIQVAKAEDGISVKVNAADPETVQKVQESLTAYFEGLQESIRERARRRAERAEEGERRQRGPREAEEEKPEAAEQPEAAAPAEAAVPAEKEE